MTQFLHLCKCQHAADAAAVKVIWPRPENLWVPPDSRKFGRHSNHNRKSHCFNGFQVSRDMSQPAFWRWRNRHGISRDTPLLVRKAILDVAVGLPPGVTPGDHLRASQWSRAQNIKLVLPPVPVGQALCSLPLPSPAQPRPAGGRRMLLAFPSWKGVLVLGFRGSQGRSPRRVQESLLPPIHPRIPPTSPKLKRGTPLQPLIHYPEKMTRS